MVGRLEAGQPPLNFEVLSFLGVPNVQIETRSGPKELHALLVLHDEDLREQVGGMEPLEQHIGDASMARNIRLIRDEATKSRERGGSVDPNSGNVIQGVMTHVAAVRAAAP
jgi:hypothetical protein